MTAAVSEGNADGVSILHACTRARIAAALRFRYWPRKCAGKALSARAASVVFSPDSGVASGTVPFWFPVGDVMGLPDDPPDPVGAAIETLTGMRQLR